MVDLSHADCVVRARGFTYEAHHNVCTGEVVEVPLGAIDMLLGCLVCMLAVCLGICFFAMLREILKT